MVFREFFEYTFQFLIETVLHIISFILCWDMLFRTMILTSWPLSIMYDILSLTNSTFLTSAMLLLCTNNLYLIHGSYSPFHIKLCILLQVLCHHPPIWLPALPLNLTYICMVPSTVIRDHTLYILLTFHIPNLMPIFCLLGYLSKESIEVQGSLISFITSLVC
jgi:hypothetical protein